MKFIFCLILSCSVLRAMSPADAEKIADAIYKVEGGKRAKAPYGILSVKVKNEQEARKVCLNTIRNNFKRWNKTKKELDYFEFLGNRYAPIGAANDPKSLNKNWINNIKKILGNEFIQKIK